MFVELSECPKDLTVLFVPGAIGTVDAVFEYSPQPPFDAGSPLTAPSAVGRWRVAFTVPNLRRGAKAPMVSKRRATYRTEVLALIGSL